MEKKLSSSASYNNYRKNLLKKIDSGNMPNNVELGMYDLTPYFHPESFDIPLAEKILFLQNDTRKIEHIKEKDISFTPNQYDALSKIFTKNRLIISAPTSFGKTLILKEYIYKAQPNIVVYIVPTNALAYELERSFKANPSFESYTIFDKNKNPTEIDQQNKLLFIGTQEKFLEIKNSLDKIDLFVIDEAYKLSESVEQERAYKLSQAFLDSIVLNSKKICLLCPNARLIGFDKYDFYIFNTTFNIVDREYYILKNDGFYQKVNEKSQKEKTILYCSTPKDINDISKKLHSLDYVPKSLLKTLEQDFHPEWTVIKLLKKGILTHHGLMPKFVQNRMINCYLTNEQCKLLVGTNSISEGINTPTKNLFLDPSCNIEQNLLLLKNTIGRAGRLGQYPIGHIYSDKNISYIDKEEILVELAIDAKEDKEEIDETNDENKKLLFCNKNSIDLEFYNHIINNYHISSRRFQLIINALKENLFYPNIDKLPFILTKVKYDYHDSHNDRYYIKGVLQKFFLDKDTNAKIYLSNFSNKILCIRQKNEKSKKMTDSEIIDGYMKFIYSTLDYDICPIVNIGKEIMDKYPEWPFGKNVKNTINIFNKKYYDVFFGIANFDNYSENQKRILLTLREYGINVKDSIITIDMLAEIEHNLKSRYSTYDIVNAIKKLSTKSNEFNQYYKNIIDKYFSND